MIIKLVDREFEEVDYIEVNKYDEHIQEKLEFFFYNDFDEGNELEILNAYNDEFEESLNLKQVKNALNATEYGNSEQSIDSYFAVFEALGYEPHGLSPEEDLEMVIEGW